MKLLPVGPVRRDAFRIELKGDAYMEPMLIASIVDVIKNEMTHDAPEELDETICMLLENIAGCELLSENELMEIIDEVKTQIRR